MDSGAWDQRYADDDLVWSAGPNRFVVEQVDGLAPGRTLDLAGGEGRNAIWLAQQGWDVELVEFSRVALDKAARRADHAGVELTLTSADLTTSPALRSADLVLLAYLQLPRGPSTSTTRFAASAVGPGGTLLIVAHARRNLDDGVGGPQDPDVLRTVEETVADLDGTGLDVQVAREVIRTVETDEGPRDAIDLLVRADRTGSAGPPH